LYRGEFQTAALDQLAANFRSWEISFSIPAVFRDKGKSFDNIQDFRKPFDGISVAQA